MTNDYPLWGHLVFHADLWRPGNEAVAWLIVTRARSQPEAHDYMRRCYGDFVVASPVNQLPVGSAEEYNYNHAPGWMDRPPVWLVRERKV